MLKIWSKHCHDNKLNMLIFIIIYQVYTTILLTCVNTENLSKAKLPEMALVALNEAEAGAAPEGATANIYSNSNSNISNNSSNPICGNTQKMADNCFRDLPPHLMEFLQTSKIAINEKDIVSKCNVFRRGMKCFDDYTSRCIPSNNINILNNNVEGARKFFTKFCEDKTFQEDIYTKHGVLELEKSVEKKT